MRFAGLVACALALITARARADVTLALGPSGHIGAWLVSGPMPRAPALELSGVAPALGTGPASWTPHFRLLADGDSALDLARALGAKNKGARAVAAGTLVLQRDLDGWLLLSVDGDATLQIGERVIWKRAKAQARDRSTDAIPLALPAGAHPVFLVLGHASERWELDVRIVDRERLAPPRGATWVLGNAGDRDAARLVRELLTLELRSELGEDAWLPKLSVSYERGAPRGVDLSVRALLRGSAATPGELRLGSVLVGERGAVPFRATLPAPTLGAGTAAVRLTADVRVGSARLAQSALVSGRALAAAARARRLVVAIRSASLRGLSDPDVIAATLEFRLERLAAVANRRNAPPSRLDRATRNLIELCDAIEGGRDPLHEPGVRRLARRSVIDDTLQRLWVHVPKTHAAGGQRRYPLVIALHGFGGRPRGVLRAFLGRDSNAAHPAVDGFVVAPEAHGNSFYRGAGEAEVLSTLDWALRAYPIDPARVSITGVSMGGTGSAHIALRYADRFAAASPLCGYHSYFIRRDVQNKRYLPWEALRMHHWSPVSWAERGRHLPLYVAHGTKDFPLENSRVLIRRYRELGYDISEEWPEIGHHVWEITYAGARLWPWLTGKARPSAPERVTLVTDSLRHGALYWLRLTRLSTPGARAQADVRRTTATHALATTSGVSAVEMDPPGRAADAPFTLEIDGARLDFEAGAPVAAERVDGAWQRGRVVTPAGDKRAGLEGPIRDVFLGKVAFVWGSLDPRTLAANREVAEAFARGRHGVRTAYRVLADRNLVKAIEDGHSLFLVGTSDDNLVLSQIAPRLPIATLGAGLRVGQRRVTGQELGALFIHPDPRRPERYVVVLTAPNIAGLYRALSLPDLLPDYVVYDAGVAPAAGQQVLGDASVVAAGFFGWDWSLP